MGKKHTSLRIDEDTLNYLHSEGVNVSNYVEALIFIDLRQRTNPKCQELARKDEAERQRRKHLDELKLIGAIRNIDQRIEGGSKNDRPTKLAYIRTNIKLLENERQLHTDNRDIIQLIDIKLSKLRSQLK
jgi:hypothetical protein